MKFSTIAAAVAALCGGTRQYRAPGLSREAMLADHPIAATSRFWMLQP